MRTDVSVTVPGDVCAPKGFQAAGVHCGIKADGKPDLALLHSESEETSVAGVFTRNRVRAAPVRYCEEVVARGKARAVVVNSGNANACTGDRGMRDTREMASLAAEALSLDPDEVLVASTGIIGVHLPMDALREGIPIAARRLAPDGGDAADAILTTDRFRKTAMAQVRIGDRRIAIGGMAKGAGMIHPRMATTLGFLTTDARVRPGPLREALVRAADASFNCITVDGETSTNDSLFVLASGVAGGPPLESDPEMERFTEALTAVAATLARMVPRDGEGAEHLVHVRVEGARSDDEARRAADAVATSLLVKTALHSADPNWGRVMAALGGADVAMEEASTDIWIGPVRLVRGGAEVPENREAARERLRDETVELRIELAVDSGSASVWTCDLGEEYVRINTEYN